jgi:hypothetical protein
MNAYQLADKLDLEPYGIYGEQAANMLRQQADRIAELEQEKIRAYDNGFEDGQKSLTTNAEPVDWMHKLNDDEIAELFEIAKVINERHRTK